MALWRRRPNLCAVALFLVVPALRLCCQTNRTFDAVITLSLPASQFYVRQPVWLSIRVVNRGTVGPHIVNRPWTQYCFVLDSQGNRLSLDTPAEESVPISRVKPGEVMEKHINLVRPYFLLGKRDPCLPPGRYSVYFHWNEVGYESLTSDTITFLVSNPKGQEYKALTLLNEGDRMYRLKKFKEFDARYEELVQKYPESMYAAGALELIFRNHLNRYGTHHREIRIKTARRLLEQYPYHVTNLGLLLYDLEETYRMDNDIPGLKACLETLVQSTPNPKLRSMAEKALRRIGDRANRAVE